MPESRIRTITLLKEFNDDWVVGSINRPNAVVLSRTFEGTKCLIGHTGGIRALDVYNECLYSFSSDSTIRQWNNEYNTLKIWKVGSSPITAGIIKEVGGKAVVFVGNEDGCVIGFDPVSDRCIYTYRFTLGIPTQFNCINSSLTVILSDSKKAKITHIAHISLTGDTESP